MPAPEVASLSFAPLGDHDLTGFSCGQPDLDRYLRTQARQDAKRRVAAPFVMTNSGGQILGYYTLSAYGVRLTELPDSLVAKLPKYPLLPATLLGRLAISQAHRGQKLGRLLLMDALWRSWKNSSEIASVAVVAEAIDDSARQFYVHHEFLPLAGQPNRLFIAMSTLDELFR